MIRAGKTQVTDDTMVWDGKPINTIGNLLDAATKAQTDGHATEFLTAYRASSEHADQNLGYVIGYLGQERRQEMYAAYGLTHPVFGGAV